MNEPMIYAGPNIYGMALLRYQVYRGGLPPYVKRAIEVIPEIESLIVPVSQFEETEAKINRPGTNESRLFHEIQKSAKKVK